MLPCLRPNNPVKVLNSKGCEQNANVWFMHHVCEDVTYIGGACAQ